MRRTLKRQIKQDEFRSGIEHATDLVRTHPQEIRIVLAAALVVGLGGWGLSTWQAHRRAQAEEALAAAHELYTAPVTVEQPEGAPSPAPGVRVFATAAEKYRRAAEAYDAVAKRYGSSTAGVRARYYAALCRIELGETAQAETALREIMSRGGLEGDLARLALAESERRAGRLNEAIDTYRQIVDGPAGAVPKEHALMRLASTLEEAGRLKEAGISYRRLTEEFPEGVYSAEARRRAAYLRAAS
jgi:tetratricopeptide (TPR) repeat protein